MPHKTGFEVLAWLDERHISIPIVVCSAYVSQITLRLLKRYDRLEVVTKPYKKSALRAAATRVLEQHQP